jgi:hypothetical protein
MGFGRIRSTVVHECVTCLSSRTPGRSIIAAPMNILLVHNVESVWVLRVAGQIVRSIFPRNAKPSLASNANISAADRRRRRKLTGWNCRRRRDHDEEIPQSPISQNTYAVETTMKMIDGFSASGQGRVREVAHGAPIGSARGDEPSLVFRKRCFGRFTIA